MIVGQRPEVATNTKRDVSHLLRRLLCFELSGEGDLIGLRSDRDDWNRLHALARRHRVFPLVYSAVKQIDPSALPQAWREAYRVNAARNLQLTGELFKLLDLLRQHDIPTIPFKGLTLAARVYGDVALREAGDLDLLVRREDIVRAADTLVAAGHRPIYPTATPREERYLSKLQGADRDTYLRSHGEHHLVCDERLVNVDLHWAITLREFAVRWDPDAMWGRGTSFPLSGRSVPCLCDEDLLLVLCANGAKDGWERLDRICDVAALMVKAGEALDWNAAFAAAERTGISRMLAVGLWLARNVLSAPLPAQVAPRVQDDPVTVSLGTQLMERLVSEESASGSRPRRVRFHLKIRERWRDRVRYCLEQLRPGVGDWAALPLPRWLSFLHYPIRPIRLAARYGVELFCPPAAGPSDRSSASPRD